MDCGPTCLRMIASWHGKLVPIQYLREHCYIGRQGVSMLGISHAAEQIGYRTIAVQLTYQAENEQPGLMDFPFPCIAYWQQRHFVVIYKISKRFVWVADPARGKLKLKRSFFEENWCSKGNKGIVLGLEPTPLFFEENLEKGQTARWSYLFKYLRPYRKLIFQFVLGMLAGLIFQLLFPFLTQSLIDVGVNNQNISFVWLVLIAQLVLSVSQASVQFIQSWIVLNIGRRVNVNLIHDFLAKMMRLPLGFFDSKNVGDLYQRINDNHRVESFLTGSILDTLFSMMTLLVFSIILFIYDTTIFAVFMFFSILYLVWIWAFLKWRKELDYMSFEQSAENQQALYEMINGMQEIKLQGSERKRRWQWIGIQAKLFSVQTKSLRLKQIQEFGVILSSRIKDVLITFLAARAVIYGDITLGMMVAIQYIVGQLNAPFQKFVSFIYMAQDAKISLERMSEVIEEEDELSTEINPIRNLPPNQDISFQAVSFQYNPISEMVLEGVDLEIPKGKTTAIVGASGSGKTTLLKLLLSFYQPTKGQIKIGNIPLGQVDKSIWRAKSGTVMQDGYIFSDTIAANVAESDEKVDYQRLDYALQTANIADFVYSLPLGAQTMIGSKGTGLSQGQKQRILIARAVYKNPELLLFDEATNALDANNEKQIMDNMDNFFKDRTVVVVAHRLSTVMKADQIVVLEQGKIIEKGRHDELLSQKGKYYHLIRNQLDLSELQTS